MSHYMKLRKQFLSSQPKCAVRSSDKSRDIHHSRGRMGTLLIDTRFWKAVSRRAHEWIGQNPVEARSLGLLCQPGEWNNPPKDAETTRLRGIIKALHYGKSID